MKVYQVILTGKDHPFSGGAMGIYSVSQGMDEADINEITEKYASGRYYDKPIDDEIYPYYSFFKLNSGRYCIFSGRFIDDEKENYILHGLILDEGIWPFYPVQIIGSPVFNYEADFLSNDVLELPVLDSVQEGNAVTIENTSEFIKTRMDYGYDEMIAAVLEYHESNKPVVIRNSYDSLGFWIASIQMAFPLQIAHNISFSIWDCFTRDDDAVIQCLDNNLFSVRVSNEDYLVFDYGSGIITKLGRSFGFLKIVKAGYLISRATIETFHRFLSNFKYNSLDEGIDDGYNLFVMCNFGGINMDSKRIESAFKFALNETEEGAGEDVFRMIEPSIEKIIKSMDINSCAAASEFLFKAALNSNKPALLDKTCTFFYRFIDHLTFDDKNPSYDDIYKIYDYAASINRGKSAALFKYAISQERISYITANLTNDCTPRRAAFYIRIVLSSGIEIDYSWSQLIHTHNMGLFIDLGIKSMIENGQGIGDCFETAAKSCEYFENLAVLFYNRITEPSTANIFLNAFAAGLDKQDEEQKLEIRKKVFDAGCGKLLYEEFVLHLLQADDKPAFFEYYSINVFDKIIDYSKQYYSAAVILYIQKLPHEYMYQESMKLLNEYMKGSLFLNDDGLLWVIKGFEDTQNLSKPEPDMNDFIFKLNIIKKSKSIITAPDILGMIDFAIWVEKDRTSLSVNDILKQPLDIDKLDEKRYVNYITWCLPLVIRCCKSPEDHKRVISQFGREGMDLQIFSLYLSSLVQILSESHEEGFKLLVQFYVYYFYYMEPIYRMTEDEEAAEKVKDMLTQTLMDQSQEFISDFDKCMRNEFESRGLSIPIKWKEIYVVSKVNKEKQSLRKRIASVFKNR